MDPKPSMRASTMIFRRGRLLTSFSTRSSRSNRSMLIMLAMSSLSNMGMMEPATTTKSKTFQLSLKKVSGCFSSLESLATTSTTKMPRMTLSRAVRTAFSNWVDRPTSTPAVRMMPTMNPWKRGCSARCRQPRDHRRHPRRARHRHRAALVPRFVGGRLVSGPRPVRAVTGERGPRPRRPGAGAALFPSSAFCDSPRLSSPGTVSPPVSEPRWSPPSLSSARGGRPLPGDPCSPFSRASRSMTPPASSSSSSSAKARSTSRLNQAGLTAPLTLCARASSFWLSISSSAVFMPIVIAPMNSDSTTKAERVMKKTK
mmetsp:Transcript_12576/g.22420  ORF Transcript_12576/g.22420 Transcript_12576/m.22420 type:complete len:314 (-) Transcript_12576:154-1095(-)